MKHLNDGHHDLDVQHEPGKYALKFTVDGCWYYGIIKPPEYDNLDNLTNVLTI